jgi:hypothetical protein
MGERVATDSTSEASTVYTGRFWLADRPDEQRPGRLDLDGRWPRLELAEQLTSALRQASATPSADGSVLRRFVPVDEGPDVEALTVHGRLAGVAGKVTLAGAYTLRRRGPEQQLEARHALRGGHEPGLDARFSHARLRVQHLEDWPQLGGFRLDCSTTDDGMWFDEAFAQITYKKPTVPSAEVPDGLGALRLVDRVEIHEPTARGAALTRQAWLELASPDSRTVDELWTTLVGPVSTLLSLALDTDCPPIALQVAHAVDGPWLDVHHPVLVRPGTDRPPRHQLLYREHLGLPELAHWLAASPRLRPIPALVAGVRVGSERTVENQLLELATAAEGLHRRLFPGQRVLDAEDAKRIRATIKHATDLSRILKEAALNALAFLGQPSFARRLAHLLEQATPALPGLIGDPKQWVGDIKTSRNAFAHRLEAGQDLPDLRGWWDQRESLRWVLTVVLLLHAGVSADVLAQRMQLHEPYRHFRRAAGRQWPAPTSGQRSDGSGAGG